MLCITPWRDSNILPQCESPAALEPLPLIITTLPVTTSDPILDPDIVLTSEEDDEDKFEPAEEAHPAKMSFPELKARLPEDFSGKNDDTTCWLLAMKSYFAMNNHIYKDKKKVMLTFLAKLSKGRGAIFAEGWYCWRTDHRLVQLPSLRTYAIFPFLAITADLHNARPPLPSSLIPL